MIPAVMTQKPLLLCILGMHRSGTSLLARIAGLAGAALPVNLVPPAWDNETGFWEPIEAVQLNDAFFAACQSHWESWADLPAGWSESPPAQAFVERAAAILRDEYGAARLALFKEPRASRLFPLWRRAAERAGWDVAVILAARDPAEVVASLTKRQSFSPSKSTLMWLKYMLEAERYSRDLPRVFTTFDDVMADWRGVLDRISAALGFRWPAPPAETAAAVAEFLSDSRRHHRAPPAAGRDLDWAATIYAQFCGDALDPAVFDDVAANLRAAE
jgi:hypothetical protein